MDKFGVNNGSGDGNGCFKSRVNMRIAGFGLSRYLVKENEMFVEDET